MVCAATLSSNINLFTLQGNHFFGLASGLLTFFLLRLKEIMLVFIITILLIFSTITGVNSIEYWITLTYKLTTFIPLIILLRDGNIKLLYESLKLIFILTTVIGILLTFFGYSDSTFIMYPSNVPEIYRFAGLVIEPGGYAISLLLLCSLYIRLKYLNFGYFSLTYLVMLSTQSAVLLLKIVLDYLSIKRTNLKIITFVIFSLLIYLLFAFTRIGLSINARLNQYIQLIQNLDFPFFGVGLYQHEYSQALPGFFRFILETGWLFSLVLFSYFFFKLIKNFKLIYKYIPIFIIPFVQEAYLSPLYYYCLFSLFKKKINYEK